MNILQFFHSEEELPMFNIGDKVRLKSGGAFAEVGRIYKRYYPACYPGDDRWNTDVWLTLYNVLHDNIHIVSGITKGTPAAGGWFVYVDGKNKNGWHANIFELID
jgi:hypothetical protein